MTENDSYMLYMPHTARERFPQVVAALLQSNYEL